MAKIYVISCKDVGAMECEFSTQAATVEEVVEQCADHARAEHGLKGFDPAVYAQMRACMKTVESEP